MGSFTAILALIQSVTSGEPMGMLNCSQILHWLHRWCSPCSYSPASSATVGKKAMGLSMGMLNCRQILHWLHRWCSPSSYSPASSATVGKKAMNMMRCRPSLGFFHCNTGIDTKLYIWCEYGNAQLKPIPTLAPSVVLSLLLQHS